jgi:hypothetical protein
MGIPADGPWRSAVREHLHTLCPDSVERLDLAASRARAVVSGTAIYPSPPTDFAHCHAPQLSDLEARLQQPNDPELGATNAYQVEHLIRSEWLAAEFERTIDEVNERIVRTGPNDPLVSLRKLTEQVDRVTVGADPVQLKHSLQLLCVGIASRQGPKKSRDYADLVPLDNFLERTESLHYAGVRDMGGRSL